MVRAKEGLHWRPRGMGNNRFLGIRLRVTSKLNTRAEFGFRMEWFTFVSWSAGEGNASLFAFVHSRIRFKTYRAATAAVP
jgi:hypothetical protein